MIKIDDDDIKPSLEPVHNIDEVNMEEVGTEDVSIYDVGKEEVCM